MKMMLAGLWLATAIGAAAQSNNPARPKSFPTREAHAAGYVQSTDLPDGALPPADRDGNFVLGPTHPAPAKDSGVLRGRVVRFTMTSSDSKIFPGIAREPGTFGTADPENPAKMLVPTSHPAPWSRSVTVYVPGGYKAGTAVPVIVGQDGPDDMLIAVVDAEIAAGKIPPMVVVSIQNGGGDAQGSERGLEYDTLSGTYAEFVEHEVFPRVETEAGVTLTTDPEGRAAIGGSSGAACAFIMAWYHPEWFRRVISYSGTLVNQQWPWNPATPHGAWAFPESIVANTPRKPIRIWMEVGDRDLLNTNALKDGMHDWVAANETMAKALAAKGYHYQFVFARNAGHVDRAVKQQTLAEALEYVWRGYR